MQVFSSVHAIISYTILSTSNIHGILHRMLSIKRQSLHWWMHVSIVRSISCSAEVITDGAGISVTKCFEENEESAQINYTIIHDLIILWFCWDEAFSLISYCVLCNQRKALHAEQQIIVKSLATVDDQYFCLYRIKFYALFIYEKNKIQLFHKIKIMK